MTNFIVTMKHILHKIHYHISIDMYVNWHDIKMIFLFTNKYLFKCLMYWVLYNSSIFHISQKCIEDVKMWNSINVQIH